MTSKLPAAIDSGMRETLTRELVRYAVQRAIFCKKCGGILDVDRAALWTTNIKGNAGDRTLASVYCHDCCGKIWDGAKRSRSWLDDGTLEIDGWQPPRADLAPATKIKLTRGTFVGSNGRGKMEPVPAWISPCGLLALHHGRVGGDWRISHVPTGYGVTPVVRGRKGTLRQGRELLARILARGWDWDFADPRNGPGADVATAIVAIREGREA